MSYLWKIQPFQGETWKFDDHLRSLERRLPNGAGFEEYVSVLLAAVPSTQANRIANIVENYCEEWSFPRWQEFQENHPNVHPDDVELPGYIFRTPVKKIPTRVLSEYDVPSYEEVRRRVVKSLLGVTAEEDLERKLSTMVQNMQKGFAYLYF